MSASVEAKPWDFTPVLDLLHSFTPREREGKHQQQPAKPVGCPTNGSPENDTLRLLDTVDEIETCRKLGDFGDLFQFLSQVSPPHLDSPAPKNGACGVTAVGTQRDDELGHKICERVTSGATEAKTSCSLGATVPELLLTTTTTAANIAPQEQEQTKPFQPKAILRRSTTSAPVPVAPAQPKAQTGRSRLQVESVLTGSPAERKLDLISKLLQHYAAEKSQLQKLKLQSSPPRASTGTGGIHVFIDMSNVSHAKRNKTPIEAQ